MKIGLVGYTNLSSGIGVFVYEFWKYLKADSILSVNASIKGQERWTDRQLTSIRPPTKQTVQEYFEKFRPDVVMFLETPFSLDVFPIARAYGARTVAIPMHETISARRLNQADLMICTCKEAWRKSSHLNKRLLFLPIGLQLFRYRNRKGHTFVTNIGYAGVNDRRQSARIAKAFSQVRDPSAKLIMRCQHDWPPGAKSSDRRITYVKKDYPEPKDIYEDGDIAILPIAYGGYERSILESMASGMPTLTMNADPMNLYQHNPDFLLKPCRKWKLTQHWVVDTDYNEVSVDDLRSKMEWLLGIDTAKYSEEARRQAVAQSWESEEIDYKSLWMETLERLCST